MCIEKNPPDYYDKPHALQISVPSPAVEWKIGVNADTNRNGRRFFPPEVSCHRKEYECPYNERAADGY